LASFLCAADMKTVDLANLAECVRHLESQGIDELHFDMADGRFIPQFGFSAAMIGAVKEVTDLPCHAHLLIEQPERMLPALLKTPVDTVSLHVEACVHVHRALSLIKDSGKQAGLAVLPTTALTKVNYCLPLIDRLVLLGSDPIRPAVAMPRGSFERVRILHENIQYNEYAIEIDVDGRLTAEDGARCIRFGARRLVVNPTDAPGVGEDNMEALEYYRQEVAMLSQTV